MSFRFSARSLRSLDGVHEDLVAVAYHALSITSVDFGVTEGLRTAERQKALLAAGASTVRVSRHQSGHAIDVMAYIGARGSWELPLYCQVALAFRRASVALKIPIRWGGCWRLLSGLPDNERGIMDAVQEYSRRALAQGSRPLIDGPHFEMPK